MQNLMCRPGGLALTDMGAKKALINQTSSVLDIGCGMGHTLKYLHDTYGCRISGIDLSSDAIAAAEKCLPDASLIQADACKLPFEPESFQAVFMECTLTLFSEPLTALKEAYRVLSPGGTLIISTLSQETGNSLVSNGTACLNQLQAALCSIGFYDITYTDHTNALVQFVADAIFQYGSLNAYLEYAAKILGGSIFNCNLSPKKTHYHMIIAQK